MIMTEETKKYSEQTIKAAEAYYTAQSELLGALPENTVIGNKEGKDITAGSMKAQVDAQLTDLKDPAKDQAVVDNAVKLESAFYLADSSKYKDATFTEYLKNTEKVTSVDTPIFKKFNEFDTAEKNKTIQVGGDDNQDYANEAQIKKDAEAVNRQTIREKLNNARQAFQVALAADPEAEKTFHDIEKERVEKEKKDGKGSWLANFKEQNKDNFMGMLIGLLEQAFPDLFQDKSKEDDGKDGADKVVANRGIAAKTGDGKQPDGKDSVVATEVDPLLVATVGEVRKNHGHSSPASQTVGEQIGEFAVGVATLPFKVVKGALGAMGVNFKGKDKNPCDDISVDEKDFMAGLHNNVKGDRKDGKETLEEEKYKELVNNKHSKLHALAENFSKDGDQMTANVKRYLKGEDVELNKHEKKTVELINAAADEMKKHDIVGRNQQGTEYNTGALANNLFEQKTPAVPENGVQK
jgi:hypothetical protein